jgi:hypothetical protein
VKAEQMTMEELLALPVAFGIRTAALALGLGASKAYEYAARGEIPGDPPIPVRKYGQEYRVTRPDLFRALGLDPGLIRAPEQIAEAQAAKAS